MSPHAPGAALLVSTRDSAGVYGSLMTYRSPVGRVRLLAICGSRIGTGAEIVLAAAFGSGPLDPYARLRLGPELTGDGADPRRASDAVLHPPPGLRADGVMARFRSPAYAAVRDARDARLSWLVPPGPASQSRAGPEVPGTGRVGTQGR